MTEQSSAPLNNTLNLSKIQSSLAVGMFETGVVSSKLKWLYASYRSPQKFWERLIKARNQNSPRPLKSVPFQSYDFFHDMMTVTPSESRAALKLYDAQQGWQAITYGELGRWAARKAVQLTMNGVVPGSTLCVVHPLGIEWAVALLAGLKIGAVISYLPPNGRAFLTNRLNHLSPDFIITDENYSPMMPAFQDRILLNGATLPTEFNVASYSHVYQTGDTVFQLFDPASETPHIPVAITADTAYLTPMRDGLIALGLKPGHIYTAPGFHLQETQPSLALAGWLTGATFLYLTPDQVAANLDLLTTVPLHAFGISEAIREQLIESLPKSESLCNYWFRNPAETADMSRWDMLVRKCRFEDIPHANLKWDTAGFGLSLFSPKREGAVDVNVLPSAGVPWGMKDSSDLDVAETLGFGRLSICPPGREETPVTVSSRIAAQTDAWIYAGVTDTGKCGRHYPVTEVLEVLSRMPSTWPCTIVTVPTATHWNPQIILLVFTGVIREINQGEARETIATHIKREMGTEFLFDQILFFKFAPRRNAEGLLDHAWCRGAFLSGALAVKAEQAIHQSISRLKELIYQT